MSYYISMHPQRVTRDTLYRTVPYCTVLHAVRAPHRTPLHATYLTVTLTLEHTQHTHHITLSSIPPTRSVHSPVAYFPLPLHCHTSLRKSVRSLGNILSTRAVEISPPIPHHTTSPLLFLLIAYRNKIQREIDQCRYIQ